MEINPAPKPEVKPVDKYEIPILHGHLLKMRKELRRNTKRTLKLEQQSPAMKEYLSKYFMKLDDVEQKLIKLGVKLKHTLRDYPQLIELVIIKFGNSKEKHAAVPSD